MAIVIEGRTDCSICGVVLAEGEDIVAFPHFIQDQMHPLWRFSDSAMHRSCFSHWSEAVNFCDYYNRIWPKLMPNHRRQMLLDGSIVDIPKQPPMVS